MVGFYIRLGVCIGIACNKKGCCVLLYVPLLVLQVFCCLPSDFVTTFEKLREYRSTTPPAITDPVNSKTRLLKVKGHLVMYPLNFLKDEILKNHAGVKQNMVPSKFWMWDFSACSETESQMVLYKSSLENGWALATISILVTYYKNHTQL